MDHDDLGDGAGPRDIALHLAKVIRRGHLQLGEAIERLAGQIHNTVLLNELIPFDNSGLITRSWRATCGSVILLNYASADVTMASGPLASTAPVRGVGVGYVPAGTFLTMPVDDTQLAIYGTPSSGNVALMAFTGMIPFGCGAVR